MTVRREPSERILIESIEYNGYEIRKYAPTMEHLPYEIRISDVYGRLILVEVETMQHAEFLVDALRYGTVLVERFEISFERYEDDKDQADQNQIIDVSKLN